MSYQCYSNGLEQSGTQGKNHTVPDMYEVAEALRSKLNLLELCKKNEMGPALKDF